MLSFSSSTWLWSFLQNVYPFISLFSSDDGASLSGSLSLKLVYVAAAVLQHLYEGELSLQAAKHTCQVGDSSCTICWYHPWQRSASNSFFSTTSFLDSISNANFQHMPFAVSRLCLLIRVGSQYRSSSGWPEWWCGTATGSGLGFICTSPTFG